eukprot:6202250-Amphidinium_carterae.1
MSTDYTTSKCLENEGCGVVVSLMANEADVKRWAYPDTESRRSSTAAVDEEEEEEQLHEPQASPEYL